MSKERWDVYTWIGHGDMKIRESNLSLKDAKKAKEKWMSKSPKHQAFLALHSHKTKLTGILETAKAKPKPKHKTKAKDKAKDKAKAKDKVKDKLKSKVKDK